MYDTCILLTDAKRFQGYVLIEYEKFEEAKAAISGMNGAKLFGQTISGDWAFSTGSFGGNLRCVFR